LGHAANSSHSPFVPQRHLHRGFFNEFSMQLAYMTNNPGRTITSVLFKCLSVLVKNELKIINI
jgi:hypothetical protein